MNHITVLFIIVSSLRNLKVMYIKYDETSFIKKKSSQQKWLKVCLKFKF